MEEFEQNKINTINEVVDANADSFTNLRLRLDDGKSTEELIAETKRYIKGGDRKAFVSEEDERLTGFVQIKLAEEAPEEMISPEILKDLAHLARIGVAPEHQGQGIAKKLLEQAELWARENGKLGVWLDYLAENEVAENLYKNSGYKDMAEFTDKLKNKLRRVAVKRFE